MKEPKALKPLSQNHFESLLEVIEDKFQVIVEGNTALRQRIEEGEKRSDAQHGETRRMLELHVHALHAKIDGVEKRLDTKIDGVEKRLDAKIDGVEKRLDAKIDGVRTELKAEIKGVETRLGERIDAVGRDLSEHRADTEVHQKQYKVSEG